ncbi:unnamed protein product [marine sediment metagenome]|uniref:tRNA pseudouridine(55) synthase n=1 Tax=marine sediment metagenome TaxID=412755 RepID=X1F6T2_9ZZZZ
MQLDFTKESLQEGQILSFDKPYGWTSYYLVNKIRYYLCKFTGIKKLKVGHAGTLDPLATGLIILCTGKATKGITEIQKMPKEYIAEITFGATTPSHDLETRINKTYDIEHITMSLIAEKLASFRGKIQQIPPLFSAKNINGVRAYKLARKGIRKQLKAAEIEIYDYNILDFISPVIKLKIKCSKGTYIRAIARDLGERVGSGGYLTALKRTAIGDYLLVNAINVEKFKKKLNFL